MVKTKRLPDGRDLVWDHLRMEPHDDPEAVRARLECPLQQLRRKHRDRAANVTAGIEDDDALCREDREEAPVVRPLEARRQNGDRLPPEQVPVVPAQHDRAADVVGKRVQAARVPRRRNLPGVPVEQNWMNTCKV